MAAKSSPGRLYGVGVGPGDPELLTVKAVRILQQVPIICVPKAERASESVALSIVQHLISPERQRVVSLPFPTSGRVSDAPWEKAVGRMVDWLGRGQDVAFVTEGDPLLYSTFGHVMRVLTLRHPEMDVVVVPGVSSLTAAAAAARVPLACRGERVALLPAAYGLGMLRETLAQFETVVLFKVNRVMPQVRAVLEETGLLDHAVYVQRATTSGEEVVRNLRQLGDASLDYFSLLIISRWDGDA